jgi:hypothetical protein
MPPKSENIGETLLALKNQMATMNTQLTVQLNDIKIELKSIKQTELTEIKADLSKQERRIDGD